MNNPFPEYLADAMASSMDGAHWGLSDWYPPIEQAIQRALAEGANFDTGWYASKKEIASGRVRRTGSEIVCEASVMDDLDTEGYGSTTITAPASLEQITQALYSAWDEAEDAQENNRVYQGFAIGHAGSGGNRTDWVYTFIAPRGDGHCLDEPPGDNYHRWGFEEDGEDIDLPVNVQEAIAGFCNHYPDAGQFLIVDGWRVDPW